MRFMVNGISQFLAIFMILNNLYAMDDISNNSDDKILKKQNIEETSIEADVTIFLSSNGLTGKSDAEAILLAMEKGRDDIAKQLIKTSIVSSKNRRYDSYFIENLVEKMLKHDNEDLLKYLLEMATTYRYYFNVRDLAKEALNNRKYDVLKFLIETAIANKNRDCLNFTPFAMESMGNCNFDIVKFFIKTAIENDNIFSDAAPLLALKAIEIGDIEVLKYLVEIAAPNTFRLDWVRKGDNTRRQGKVAKVFTNVTDADAEEFIKAIASNNLNKIYYFLFLTGVNINRILDRNTDHKEQLRKIMLHDESLQYDVGLRGILKIDGLAVLIFDLTLDDIIKQLQDLDSLSFTRPLDSDRQYADIVMQVYRNNRYQANAPCQEFYNTIKNIFSDQSKWPKLQELGFTELDAAFVFNDKEAIRALGLANTENTIYRLGQKYRMADFSLGNKNYDALILPISTQNGSIAVFDLPDNAFVNQSSKMPDSLLIHISLDGEGTWDYNQEAYLDKYMAPSFDITIQFGNGSQYITNDKIQILLGHNKVNQLKQQNLACALVFIHGHGSEKSQEYSPILKSLYKKLARTTIVMLCSCYSGQYHDEWNGEEGVFFISTSKQDESTFCSTKAFEFSKYFPNQVNLLGILNFCLDSYKDSTPCFSGKIADKTFRGVAIKDLLKDEVITERLRIADAIPAAHNNDSEIQIMKIETLDVSGR